MAIMTGVDVKLRALKRLRIIGGQIRGLEQMLERGEYCVKIIYQSLAVKKALSSLEDLILKNHLETHAAAQMRSGKKAKAIDEILSIVKLTKQK